MTPSPYGAGGFLHKGVDNMEIDKDALGHIWDAALESIKSAGIDVATVRLDGRQGKWFLASRSGNAIAINNSTTKSPSVDLSQERCFGKEEFMRIGLLYEGWRNGATPRNIIRNLSENTSYIFGIIERFK
jgi:hypothetical protein